MPGTQPSNGVNLEAPNRCLNCHAGYNTQVEPGFNWKGSMMAQAARDFVYWACLTVAGQDSIWAIGTPNAVDICERCHFPEGWLGGRSDPPNASAMTGSDFDGIHCDFCHRMYDPFFETTYNGTREGNDWLNYWDETNLSSTPSQPAADATRQADLAQAQNILQFTGLPFFQTNASGLLVPFSPEYVENTSGQYYVSSGSEKRASFADAAARHQMLYSRHHKSKYMCGTCHDVSNPALANLYDDPTQPLTTERLAAHRYFHVERTFSEFMLSAYGQQGGAPGIGPFAPTSFNTSLANNNISKCQDCHMRDVEGVACNKAGVPIRPGGSVEHPNSGLPLHDLTGGNVFVSTVLASAIPGSPIYDAANDQLLNQGPAALTLDLSQGQGVDPVALKAGADRAHQQLLLAASIQNVQYSAGSGDLSFQIQNQTGHRLISGFPEGRRMYINVKAFDASGALIHEVNPFDAQAGTLKGLPYTYDDPDTQFPALPDPLPLDPATEQYVDSVVYEMHPESALTGEHETFHFALATGRWKDNRIPPKGYRIAEAATRNSVPVEDGVENENYFTAQEYAGGYDDVALTIAPGAAVVQISLYYQTTSREYMEFLRNEINGSGSLTLADPSPLTGLTAYRVQSDPFFGGLKAWGDTIWKLWKHNYQAGVLGAAPVLMTQANLGGTPCAAPQPTLLTATPGNGQVTLLWSDEFASDSSVAGYNVYYDQAGKAQLIDTVGPGVTTYIDAGLTNGQEYCYKVSSFYDASCESSYSNTLCAIPNNQGQARVGVDSLATGRYEKSGKGKGATTIFVATTTFAQGDAVVMQAHVIDKATGLAVPNATVNLAVSGPEPNTFTAGPSGSDGIAEVSWQTSAPNRRGQGGTTPGTYTVTVTGVTASGYTWDGVQLSSTFTLQ